MTVGIERLRRSRGTALRIDAQRFMASFILAGYGIFILSLFARNVMSWYINPAYVGPTTLAGAVLLAMGVVRFAQPATVRCEADACACEDSKPKLGTYAILCIPLLLALIFPTRGLASFSANQRGPQIAGLSVLHGASTVQRVSLSVDTRSFSMMDWVGALSADPNPRDYAGKPVIVSGLVLHSPGNVPQGYFMVMRYLITCCIADARPVGLIVRESPHSTLQDNQWVTVTGVMAAGHSDGQDITVVNPKTITPTKSGNPYIY